MSEHFRVKQCTTENNKAGINNVEPTEHRIPMKMSTNSNKQRNLIRQHLADNLELYFIYMSALNRIK